MTMGVRQTDSKELKEYLQVDVIEPGRLEQEVSRTRKRKVAS